MEIVGGLRIPTKRSPPLPLCQVLLCARGSVGPELRIPRTRNE